MKISIRKKLATIFGMTGHRAARRGAAGAAILSAGLAFMGPVASVEAVELIQNGSFEMNAGLNGNNAGFSWLNADGPPDFNVYNHTETFTEGPAPADAGDWYRQWICVRVNG